MPRSAVMPRKQSTAKAPQPTPAPAPAAPPTSDQPDPTGVDAAVDMAATGGDATAEVLVAGIVDLGRARALPETPAGQVLMLDPLQFAPGSIEQFADEDGRTMRIVSLDGALYKYPVPEVPAQETTTEGA